MNFLVVSILVCEVILDSGMVQSFYEDEFKILQILIIFELVKLG